MARKLNKALVAAVASVAVLGGGAYFAAPQVIKIMRPVSKMIAAGDAAAAAGDWDTAALNYGKAANRSANDIDLQLKFADALDLTVRDDPTKKLADLNKKFGELRAIQAQVLANDPRSVPALRKVLAYQKNDVQSAPNDTAAVRTLIGTADRLEKLVPDDREAKIARIVAVVEPYMRNLEVRAEDVDAQRVVADQLLADKPDDIEAAVFAGQFRVVAIQRALQQGDPAANDMIQKAMDFADEAVKKGPTNAGAWQLKSDVYRWAAYTLTKDEAKRNEYGKAFYDSLQKAAEIVPSDSDYAVPIRAAAYRQMELRDPKAAEAGYRKLVADRPDDRQPRLMLAEFLTRQPARRDEAVAVLDAPFTPTKPLGASKAINQRILSLIERVRKTAIRLGTLATVSDPDDRKKRLDVIEAEYRTLSSDGDIGTRFKPALQRIKGGIEIAQNKIAEGVNTLDDAIKLMNPDSPSSIEQDMRNDALMEYAQAQLRLNQTGQARPALQELVTRRPENLTARALLADVLLGERSFDAADREIALLERLSPDSPLVQRMRVRSDAMQDKLEAKYDKMTEETRDKQFLKLQAAATLQKNEEMARLAKAMVAANPTDPEGVAAFVEASIALDRREEAVAVVSAALKAKPNDPRFKGLAAGLAAQTAEQRVKLVDEQIENIADPYAKQLALGSVARRQGRYDDALAAYKAAQKIKPDDARAYDAQFQVAVVARKFDQADAVLADLARTNADQADGAIRRVQLAGARAAVETDAERRAAMYKDVAAQAQAVAQRHGGLASATLLYAQVLAQSGDVNGAIDQFSQTLDKAPTNFDAMLGIASCMLRTDRRSEAQQRVEAVKAAAPDDARTADLVLEYDLRFGDPAKAVETLAARVEKSPDDVQLAGRLGVALEQIAGTKQGDAAKPFMSRAADVYEKAAARFPQDLRFVSAFAEVKRRLGDPAAGEAAVEKLANDPANAGRTEIVQLLADTYARSNKPDDAIRVLANLVNAVKPPPVEPVIRLSSILAKQNRLGDAMAVLDLRKEEATVARHRVSLLLDANELKAAREAADAALAAHPDADTQLVAAFAAMRAGEPDRAEDFANKVIAQRPADVAALYYRGQARTNKVPPDLDGGIADLTKARDSIATSPDIRMALADAFRRKGDRDAMIAELQTAWAADKTNKTVLMRLVDAYSNTVPPSWSAVDRTFVEAKASPKLAGDVDVLITEAESFAFRGDTQKSVAAARAALALSPQDPQTKQRYIELLVKAKAFRDVIAETSGTAGDKPADWWLHRARGVAYRGLNQTSDAEKSLDTAFRLASATTDTAAVAVVARSVAEAFGPKAAAAKLDPFTDPQLQLMAAGFVRDGGDAAAATRRFEGLLADREKLPPGIVRRVLNDLGLLYLAATPPDGPKARAAFEELVSFAPNDLVLLNNYACAMLLPGSGATPADALKAAEKAFNLSNGSDNAAIGPIIQDTYGWALVKNNRVSEGVDILRRASESANFPDVFLHLAEAYLTTGDLNGAEAALGDARTQLDNAARAKQPVDPTAQAKFTQLTEELTKKKAANGGAE